MFGTANARASLVDRVLNADRIMTRRVGSNRVLSNRPFFQTTEGYPREEFQGSDAGLHGNLRRRFIFHHNLSMTPNYGGNRMDDEKDVKVRFETLSAEKIPFGKNNFLEVARKKAITDEGDSEFISVSRGYFLPDGSEKYKKSITIPDDPNIKQFVTEKINKL